MKRIFSILLILLMAFMFALPFTAFADEEVVYDAELYTTGVMPPRVVDNADILGGDLEKVTEYIDKLSKNLDFDIVVVTTYGYEQASLLDFADDFYDYNGYGTGSGKAGCILAVDMESRYYTMSTTGFGITALTDYGIETIYDAILDYAQDGDWAGAFMHGYADLVAKYVQSADEGKIFDDYGPSKDHYGNPIETKPDYGFMGISSVVVGALAGLISSLINKGKLKSVSTVRTANNYAKNGSMKLTGQYDNVLYRNVAVSPIPKDDSSSGGGGSSTHVGSSGTTHGGGGGRSF